ncbi:MAG: hypothetical protein RBS91_09140 [Sulfurimonadaceae bacterium]|jgi:hypothetical protein|nr:hypothetical protein [Sulfurimonadaceae bacterium]
MVYLLRWVIWLIVILIISIVIHKLLKKRLEGKWIQGFVGVITFIVIVLLPITIAKIIHTYYVFKYSPFYEIVEPLGDDFEGFYSINDFYKFHKEYPNVKYIDSSTRLYYKYSSGHEEKFEQLPNIYNNEIEQAKKEFIENKKETKIYYRTYLDKQGAAYCYFPKNDTNIEKSIDIYQKDIKEKKRLLEVLDKSKNRNFFKSEDIDSWNKLSSKTIENMQDDIEFLKSGNCIARKIIDEKEVSKYMFSRKVIKKKIFEIPYLVKVDYFLSEGVIDKSGKIYSWESYLYTSWDLYGLFNWEGRTSFKSGSSSLKKLLNKEIGE